MAVPNGCDNYSIVGASAPGEGIVLTGASGDILFRVSSNDNWTLDHFTIAAGTVCGNCDSIGFGSDSGGPASNGLMANMNFVWGGDETLQCYPQWSGAMSDVTLWQSIIGRPVGGSGADIRQNTCENWDTLRTFYIHSNGRHPLIRGDGANHFNNFTANAGYQNVQVNTCGGIRSPVANPWRANFGHNLYARGDNSSNHDYIELQGDTSCTSVSIYEENTRGIDFSSQIENCANHSCIDGFSAGELEETVISTIYPTGYVPEVIGSNQQDFVDFATQVTTFAGAKPNNRGAFFDTLVAQGINHVDGSGTRGNWNGGSGSSEPLDSAATQGGVSIITPPRYNWDPTDGSENPCGEDMPTGSTADAIQSSGLTRLHEWTIGCFYDYAMPGGYRADGLQNYPAPQGRGFVPPAPPLAARPNAPSTLQIN